VVQRSRAASQRCDQKDHELLDDEAVVDETDLALQIHLCHINNEDPLGLDAARGALRSGLAVRQQQPRRALLRATPAALIGVSGRPMTACAVETKLCTPGISNRSPSSKQIP
jgi:hypothetical protein